jgi:hypothetical protein
MADSDIPSPCNLSVATGRSKRRDLYELMGIYVLILVVIWTPRPWQKMLWVVAALSISYVAWASYEGLKPMGLCTANLLRSLWGVALAVAVAIAAVMLAGRLHTLHMPDTPTMFLRRYGIYALWAAVQQLILQTFFLSRSMRLVPNATAAAGLAAVLFAIAHLPNPILTFVTLICGLASCLFFIHYRNLWPLTVAHAILGISIAISIPGPVLHNMRVGIGYLTYVDRTVLSHRVTSPKP